MSLRRLMLTLTIGSMVIVGCESEETLPATPEPAPQADQTEGVGGALKAAQDQAKDLTDNAGEKAGELGAAAKEQAGELTAAATEKAQTLYDEAVKYIQENKLDLAEKSLTQLESMKAQLPADWQSKLASAQEMLTKAKAGN